MPDRATLKRALEHAHPRWRRAARTALIPPLRAYFRYAPTQAGKRPLWDGLAAHLWWLEHEVEAPTEYGARLRVDATDVVGRYIYWFGVWEPNLTAWLQRTLVPGDVFVDVGANIGYFSVLASRLVGPAGAVVAIEALPQTHAALVANLGRNGARNVRTACVAAWDAETSLELFARAGGPAGTTTAYASWADRWELAPAVEVPARPLSAILEPLEIGRARVIKIDAEGAEWRVVKGLARSLPEARDDLEVMLEIAPALLAEDGATTDDVAALFAEHGFRPYRLANDYAASAYFGRRGAERPRLITELPRGAEQFDVIFSRSSQGLL